MIVTATVQCAHCGAVVNAELNRNFVALSSNEVAVFQRIVMWGNDVQRLFAVGQTIEFDFFGQLKRGEIVQVGQHGYWIEDTKGCYGSGSIRCPFEKAILVAT